MAVYRVQTNKGTYWWGSNRPDWQTTFAAKNPGVRIISFAPTSVASAPAQYKSVLTPYAGGTPTKVGTAATARTTTATAPKVSTPQTVENSIVDNAKKFVQQQTDLYKKLFVNDPLAIDKGLTESSQKAAREMVQPEYERVLNEFLSDVGTKLESFDTRNKLIDELKGTTRGLAGRANIVYQQAKDAALEGLAASNELFSGISRRKLGVAEAERGRQFETAAEQMERQKAELEQSRITGTEDITTSLIKQGFAQQALPKLLTFAQRFPFGTAAEQQQRNLGLLQQFNPTQFAPRTPALFEPSRSIGL